jgi:hypothetical protein
MWQSMTVARYDHPCHVRIYVGAPPARGGTSPTSSVPGPVAERSRSTRSGRPSASPATVDVGRHAPGLARRQVEHAHEVTDRPGPDLHARPGQRGVDPPVPLRPVGTCEHVGDQHLQLLAPGRGRRHGPRHPFIEARPPHTCPGAHAGDRGGSPPPRRRARTSRSPVLLREEGRRSSQELRPHPELAVLPLQLPEPGPLGDRHLRFVTRRGPGDTSSPRTQCP